MFSSQPSRIAELHRDIAELRRDVKQTKAYQEAIITLLQSLVRQGVTSMASTINAKTVIDNLRAEVEAERDENAAAVVLIQNLVEEIKAAATQGDLQAVQALTDQAHANSQALADAIKSNTASGQPNV